MLDVDGHPVEVSGWRGTVGNNWGSEHADRWVWLHAADFDTAPEGWLELVLARIRIGRVRSPWTAMGALSLGGRRIPLGGLGRLPRVEARPGQLTARVPSPGPWLQLRVTTAGQDAVDVAYADPSGGTRAVRHAARAAIVLAVHGRGGRELTLSGGGAYEYGTSQDTQGIIPEPLPEG
jgi:hypothetical protein